MNSNVSKQTRGKNYATANTLDAHVNKFCEQRCETSRAGIYGWEVRRRYKQGTPDETEFVFRASDLTKEFDKEDCKNGLPKKIIHGCDANDPDNPMNWKWGGRYKKGEWTPTREGRAWPAPKEVRGWCGGRYHLVCSDYIIKGKK